MHRFFVPDLAPSGTRLRLGPEEAHHASRVLRLGPGDPVVLLDGRGGECHAVIESAHRQEVVVSLQKRMNHPAPVAEVVLVQAVAKSAAMELGCQAIQPLLTDHSVSRPDDAESKREKWQSIAIEAAKQSGNPWLTRIEPLRTPREWLASMDLSMDRPPLIIIASLADSPESLRTILSSSLAAPGTKLPKIAVLIGPEGDFSPQEYDTFREIGARPISLGPLVLRVETAAIALLAMVQYELRLIASRS